jgi:hypothetical protein
MADTPLEHVPGWSRDHVKRMKDAWITSAEQVVALSATQGGIRSLAEQLEVPEEEARGLVEAARNELSPSARAEAEEVIDTSNYGLGALHPKEDEDAR